MSANAFVLSEVGREGKFDLRKCQCFVTELYNVSEP